MNVREHYTEEGIGNWADFELDLINAISAADIVFITSNLQAIAIVY